SVVRIEDDAPGADKNGPNGTGEPDSSGKDKIDDSSNNEDNDTDKDNHDHKNNASDSDSDKNNVSISELINTDGKCNTQPVDHITSKVPQAETTPGNATIAEKTTRVYKLRGAPNLTIHMLPPGLKLQRKKMPSASKPNEQPPNPRTHKTLRRSPSVEEIPSSDSSDSSRKVSKRRHRKIVTNVSDASKTLPENNKTRKRQRVDKNNNTEVSGKRTKANGEKRQVRKSRWTPSQQSILEEYFELDRYPPKQTVQEISERAGLSIADTRKWFANQRRKEQDQLKNFGLDELMLIFEQPLAATDRNAQEQPPDTSEEASSRFDLLISQLREQQQKHGNIKEELQSKLLHIKSDQQHRDDEIRLKTDESIRKFGKIRWTSNSDTELSSRVLTVSLPAAESIPGNTVLKTLRKFCSSSYRLGSTVSLTRGMPSIGTHDGKFHCDEVFACFLLKSLPEFSRYEIV
ncbi:unnamed protein product, partial [Anisakis simplex]|uniref:Homeobox domain-containing protein n=1 Tax=Anisakis simplex TaxID=6269 RepID=A0A0M3KBI7_ANISI